MVTVDELLRNTNEFVGGGMSLEEFDNWFEDNTIEAHTDAAVCEVYEAIEAALAEYYFDHIGQDALKRELASAIRPFERPFQEVIFRRTVSPAPCP